MPQERSTVAALLHIIAQWLQALEERHDICAVFFDFCKAFDSVPHEPLIIKFTGLILNTSVDGSETLTNRQQVVRVNGAESSEAAALSGVPQGSGTSVVSYLHR